MASERGAHWVASSVAKRMSHIIASEKPAPMQAPLTAAITGLGISVRKRWRRSFSGRPLPQAMSSRAAMSAPAQKTRPAPVMTITLTAGSSAAARTIST